MEDWNVTLESDALDRAFVTKAKEFEEKLKINALSDDEITAWDNELVGLFNEQDLVEEDSPEVKAANRKREIAEAKNEIAEAETIEALTALQKKFEHLPELDTFIEKRIEKIRKATEDAQQNKFLTEATEEIKATDYPNLPALLEKYKDHPDLIKLIQTRIEKEKPHVEPTLREKLSGAKKREWSYDDLRAIGITPTGNDMEIEGVLLKRQYLVYVYKIEKVDGKRV
jgi:hypothetical protein